MKKVSLAAVAGCMSLCAFAQNGIYLTPSVGAGSSNIKPHIRMYSGVSQSAAFSYHAGVGIGYRYKNWRLQSGIQFLSSGYQLNSLKFTSNFDPLNPDHAGNDQYNIQYSHIGVPLQIGYTIFPQKKLSLVPYLGVFVSYNTGAKSMLRTNGMDTKISWSKDDFERKYNSMSIWGTAALYLEYKVTKKISIFGGPSLHYMISNFGKQVSLIPEDIWKQRNQSTTFDLGVSIRL